MKKKHKVVVELEFDKMVNAEYADRAIKEVLDFCDIERALQLWASEIVGFKVVADQRPISADLSARLAAAVAEATAVAGQVCAA